jgi:cytochrome c-type biogenesis protein CcmH/NrfG
VAISSKSLFSLVACFVAGFLAGVVFSAWKLDRSMDSAGSQGRPVEDRSVRDDPSTRIKGLEKMVQANPDNLQALVQLANDYYDTNNHEKAVEYYQKAVKLDPRNADVLTDMGVSLRKLGKTKESVDAFGKALDVDPDHTLALFNLGIVLRDDLKDDAGALKVWEAFLQKAGNSPHAVMIKPWVDQLRNKLKTLPSPVGKQ